MKSKELKTHLAIAICKNPKCWEILVSTGGGRFVECKCKKSFIDQERWDAVYVRLGGKAAFIAQICPKGCKQKEHKEK
jgi:hypothetical protein